MERAEVVAKLVDILVLGFDVFVSGVLFELRSVCVSSLLLVLFSVFLD